MGCGVAFGVGGKVYESFLRFAARIFDGGEAVLEIVARPGADCFEMGEKGAGCGDTRFCCEGVDEGEGFGEAGAG